MRRREFIAGIGAAAAWTFRARAQQPLPTVAFVTSRSENTSRYVVDAFRKGLGETGYVEDRNVTIEYRWAEGHNDRLPALAADLVRRQVTVIAAPNSTPAALAARAATATIPIVFAVAVDPVEVGLVVSLNRPGGNLTGITSLNVEVGPKRLELLQRLLRVEGDQGPKGQAAVRHCDEGWRAVRRKRT
jgi:putative tryptophan/tyrosine transport system substrate-binding protein